MMDREAALALIEENVKNPNLIKHMLATEACMRSMALRFGEDPAVWGLAGLLHDLDVEMTAGVESDHGKITSRILEERSIPQPIIQAVKAHVGLIPSEGRMERALYCCDPLTGFLVACALMVKEPVPRKISSVDVLFALRRFKEKRFAAGASREQIQSCTRLGLSLEEFLDIGIKAMSSIANVLGL